MSRLTSTTVYLEEAQLTRLRDLSRQERRPVAALMREAFSEYLARCEAAKTDEELRRARHGVGQ